MRLNDLKTGMVVELKSGTRGVVMKNTRHGDFLDFCGHWAGLESYSQDFIWHKEDAHQSEHTRGMEIVKIYEAQIGSDAMSSLRNINKFPLELIWGKNTCEMTLEEICKVLGKDIKIVK